MNQELSSLMDGELEPQEAERAIRSCCASREAAETWMVYHVIGETLRGHPPAGLKRPGVLEALQSEPAIIAKPRRVYETTMGRVALAAAASVATIGVVGWIGSQGGAPASGPVMAKNPSTLQPVANVVPAQAAPADMQDYVAAHKQLPSVELYRPVNRTAPAAAAR